MKMNIYQVDAFTENIFEGNPAAVCPLESWPDDTLLQKIATENNLSETAFFVPENGTYHLRWFTPAIEVELCGHATLASAHVLFHHLGYNKEIISFKTRSGVLRVTQRDNLLVMDFPARFPKKVADHETIFRALGKKPNYFLKDLNYMAVFENEQDVFNLSPDFNLLYKIHDAGIICTAPSAKFDFVSRYFATYAGINEDPVTGSAHCSLAPYWAERLNKKELVARQVSARGGTLYCKHLGERVEISGHAVTFLKGEIYL